MSDPQPSHGPNRPSHTAIEMEAWSAQVVRTDPRTLLATLLAPPPRKLLIQDVICVSFTCAASLQGVDISGYWYPSTSLAPLPHRPGQISDEMVERVIAQINSYPELQEPANWYEDGHVCVALEGKTYVAFNRCGYLPE